MATGNRNFTHSVLRERIVEHVFVGDVLRTLWRRGVTDVEILRPEFDAHGYDVVMSCGTVVRHVQLHQPACFQRSIRRKYESAASHARCKKLLNTSCSDEGRAAAAQADRYVDC
jgi:hypothetical protein